MRWPHIYTIICTFKTTCIFSFSLQAIFLDISKEGMHFSNMNMGQFPLSGSITMLAIDVILYGLLAFYFDSVLPSKYRSVPLV